MTTAGRTRTRLGSWLLVWSLGWYIPAAALAAEPGSPSSLGQPPQHAEVQPRSCVLFSGTFDPPHLGHLDVLQHAMDETTSTCGIALLNLSSRFKPGMSALAVRQDMARLLFSADARIQLADPSLTAAFAGLDHRPVVEGLRKRYPGRQFFVLMGDDVFNKGLVTLLTDPDVTYLVSHREGSSRPLPGPPVQMVWIRPNGIQGCSSTAIRAAYAKGAIQPRCTTPALDRWIRSHGLYGSTRTEAAPSPERSLLPATVP
jgi:nicotinic acid mononucleotide adenylyltransferase